MREIVDPKNVSELGCGMYLIGFSHPILVTDAYPSLANYDISLILDNSRDYLSAVVGARKTLLFWLRDLGFGSEDIKLFEEAMKE